MDPTRTGLGRPGRIAYNAANEILGPHDAEGVAQDTMAALYIHQLCLPWPDNPKGWVNVKARGLAVDRWRRKEKGRKKEQQCDFPRNRAWPDPKDQAVDDEKFCHALHMLTPREPECFWLLDARECEINSRSINTTTFP